MPVIIETRDCLRARREQILRTLDASSVEEFRRMAQTQTLTGEEWDALEELDEIGFLLGDE